LAQFFLRHGVYTRRPMVEKFDRGLLRLHLAENYGDKNSGENYNR